MRPSPFKEPRLWKVLLSVVKHQNRGQGIHTQSERIDTQSGETQETSINTGAASLALAGSSIAITDNSTSPVNLKPDEPGISLRKPLKGLAYRLNRIIHLPQHIRSLIALLRTELTEEERREKVRQDEAKKYYRMKCKEGLIYTSRLINRYTQLQFTNKVSDGKKHRIKKVRPEMIAFDLDGRETKIKMRGDHMPEGVSYQDLIARPTLNECQPSVGHPISGTLDVEGCIVTIQVAGLLGLPDFVSIDKLWKEMPDNLPLLAFPVGIGENGHNIYKDLDDCPHLMVVGGTKQGKSNMVNGIICTYLYRLTPSQVQFILFDLKRGMEFSFYDGIKHLFIDQENRIPGIIEDMEHVLDAMRGIKTIMYKRMDYIKNAGFKSFEDYNLKHRGNNRLPALVIIFDEWAKIALTYKELADGLIADISNQARAAGIYVILASQYPKAEVLTTLATINFQVRIAFNMSQGGSMSVLGNHDAVGLPCKGRAIFQDYDELQQVQTPRITDGVIRSIVDHAITGKPIIKATVDIEEILLFALDKYGGRLDIKKLYPYFKDKKLSRDSLAKLLKLADDQIYNVKGTAYKVECNRGGNRPRKMILAETQGIPLKANNAVSRIPDTNQNEKSSS